MFFLLCQCHLLTSDWYEFDKVEYSPSLRERIFEQSGVSIPSNVDDYHVWLMYNQAVKLHIPIKILFRQIEKESGYNPGAEGNKGEIGYLQVLPSTYTYMLAKMGVNYKLKHTPERNIVVGTEYLAYLRDYWQDRGLSEDKMWEYALASYNAGKANVIAYNGVPPFRCTKEYVKFINN